MPNAPWIALAALVYLIAHLGRSFKFWIIYGDGRLSFRRTFLIFQITAVLGYWAPLLLSETLRLALLSSLRRSPMRAVIAELLSRALDLVWLGVLLSFGLENTYPGAAYTGWLGLAVGGLLIFGFYSLQQLIRPLKVALMMRAHNASAVTLLRGVDLFARTAKEIVRGFPLLMLGLLLTAGIWMLDAVALSLVLPAEHPLGGAPFRSLQRWAFQSLESIFGTPVSLTIDQLTLLRHVLFLPQLGISLVLLILFALSRRIR